MAQLGEYDRSVQLDTGHNSPDILHWDEDDVMRKLSIYGPMARMVHEFDNPKGTNHGIARFRAVGPAVRPILSGELAIDNAEDGFYTPTEIDVADHFVNVSESKDSPIPPLVLPGVRTIAVARLTADERARNIDPRLNLSRIHSVVFEKPIGVGEQLHVRFPESGVTELDEQRFGVEIRSGEKLAASMQLDYTTDARPHDPETDVDPELMGELGAQGAILTMQSMKGLETMEGILPGYAGIDEITRLRPVRKNEEVTVDVFYTGSKRQFVANAIVYNAGRDIVQVIRGMRGIVGPRRVMIRQLGDKMGHAA